MADKVPEYSIEVFKKMHSLFLEALRNREQEILKFLAILVPALGAYGWFISKISNNIELFAIGTIGVLLLLLLGAIYSLALGYNFRCITFQIAKLETMLQVNDVMLKGWPKSIEEFKKRYCNGSKKKCFPPELIKFFWVAFLVGIGGVTISAVVLFIKEMIFLFLIKDIVLLTIVLIIGTICLIIGLWFPHYFGRKMRKLIKIEDDKENSKWKSIEEIEKENKEGNNI